MMQEREEFQAGFRFLEEYAIEHSLSNTLKALPMTKELMNRYANVTDAELHYSHALSVTRMLIDLQLQLSHLEEDHLLSIALTHVIPECLHVPDLNDFFCNTYHLDSEIPDNVKLIIRKGGIQDDQKQKEFYCAIQSSKLATFVKLADRSVIVCRLHNIPIWQSKEFIYETRKYFLPLCIFAKEAYPENYGRISILMEKMRSMIDGTEILINKFEQKENEMNMEILQLKEENAHIRSILKQYKK